MRGAPPTGTRVARRFGYPAHEGAQDARKGRARQNAVCGNRVRTGGRSFPRQYRPGGIRSRTDQTASGRAGHKCQDTVGQGSSRNRGVFRRQSADLRHRASLRYCCARLQSHHRLDVFSADTVARVFDDGRILGAGVEACGLRQGDHTRQVARTGLSVDTQRQGRNPRRLASARQGRHRDRRMHPAGTEGAERAGGLHRPGRREPGVLRFHRAGQVQRQPRRHRRGHGRQGTQSDRRTRNQGRQRRPAGRIHEPVRRRAEIHQVPGRPSDSRRPRDTAGAGLAAGDEDRRRAVAHHQLHVGQCAHPAQGLLDQ